jgi:glutaredoxin 3
MRMAKVLVYSAEWCPWCHKAKAFLAKNGVEFEDRDVDSDPKASEEILKLTGQTGIPVIVVGKEAVVGFDEPRLRELLKLK